MIERLGNVIYWLCLIVAAAFVAAAPIMYGSFDAKDGTIFVIFSLGAAVVSYLTGRAFRYVLSAR